MNRSAIKANNEPCPQKIRAILPLIANGTFPDKEAEEIKAAVASNSECAKEFEEFRNLSSLIREDMTQIPVPGEALLDNILEQIETKSAKDSSPFKDWYVALSERLSGLFSLPVMQMATAVAVLVIVFQSVVIFHQSKKIEIGRASCRERV